MIFQRAGQADGSGEQVVAQQNACLVVPAGVDRIEMPADDGLVQDVVVNQGGCVNQLHHRPQHEVLVPQWAAGLAGQQKQGRTEPLPPQTETMFNQLIDKGMIAAQLVVQDVFDLFKFRRQSGHTACAKYPVLLPDP